MNACLSDFRVVNPTLRTFSAAEARIAQSSIRFNNLSAAELGYPENVRLLISSEGTTLAIQACDKDDPCAVPFMSGRTAEDLKGQKKWTTVSNRMLMHIFAQNSVGIVARRLAASMVYLGLSSMRSCSI